MSWCLVINRLSDLIFVWHWIKHISKSKQFGDLSVSVKKIAHQAKSGHGLGTHWRNLIEKRYNTQISVYRVREILYLHLELHLRWPFHFRHWRSCSALNFVQADRLRRLCIFYKLKIFWNRKSWNVNNNQAGSL